MQKLQKLITSPIRCRRNVTGGTTVAFGWTGTNSYAGGPDSGGVSYAPTLPVFQTSAPFTMTQVAKSRQYSGNSTRATCAGHRQAGIHGDRHGDGIADLDGQWQTAAMTLTPGDDDGVDPHMRHARRRLPRPPQAGQRRVRSSFPRASCTDPRRLPVLVSFADGGADSAVCMRRIHNRGRVESLGSCSARYAGRIALAALAASLSLAAPQAVGPLPPTAAASRRPRLRRPAQPVAALPSIDAGSRCRQRHTARSSDGRDGAQPPTDRCRPEPPHVPVVRTARTAPPMSLALRASSGANGRRAVRGVAVGDAAWSPNPWCRSPV